MASPGPGGGTLTGGVLVEPNLGDGKLVYNTVAFNESNGAQNDAGISCFGALNSATGNLVYANKEATTGSTIDTQFGGDCNFGNSVKLPSGDLGFRNPPPSGSDFHLSVQTPSSVRDAAGDCTGVISVDVDGEQRPSGPACDVGADELIP